MEKTARVYNAGLRTALDILDLLAKAPDGMRVCDIADRLDCSESTVVRMLQTLSEYSHVAQQEPRGPYSIGYGVLSLAGSLLDALDLRQVAHPYVHELAAKTGLASLLKVPSGTDMVTLDVHVPIHAVSPRIELGAFYPMHITSTGIAILASREHGDEQAYLENVDPSKSGLAWDPDVFLKAVHLARERGYATRSGPPLESIAAPVFRFDAEVVGAVGIRFSPLSGILASPREQELAEIVMTTARSISYALGYRADHLIR